MCKKKITQRAGNFQRNFQIFTEYKQAFWLKILEKFQKIPLFTYFSQIPGEVLTTVDIKLYNKAKKTKWITMRRGQG